jgi:hypothetical protein
MERHEASHRGLAQPLREERIDACRQVAAFAPRDGQWKSVFVACMPSLSALADESERCMFIAKATRCALPY